MDESSENFMRSLGRALPASDIVPTQLYARNREVDVENERELALLPGPDVTYEAVDGVTVRIWVRSLSHALCVHTCMYAYWELSLVRVLCICTHEYKNWVTCDTDDARGAAVAQLCFCIHVYTNGVT